VYFSQIKALFLPSCYQPSFSGNRHIPAKERASLGNHRNW